MTPAIIGTIASRYIPSGGGPVDPTEDWNFTGASYSPPVSGVAEFGFTGAGYLPPPSE